MGGDAGNSGVTGADSAVSCQWQDTAMIASDFMDRRAGTAHLIPAPSQPRWRVEWPGELHALPVPANRTGRGAETLLGVQGPAPTSPGSTEGSPYWRLRGEA